MTLTLPLLMDRIANNVLKVTKSEALQLPYLFNAKKGQYVQYYWSAREPFVYISLWQVELTIVEEDEK